MKKIILILLTIQSLFFSETVFAQIYTHTDNYAKIKFEIDDSIWTETSLTQDRNYISNKWEKDCGILMYGSSDAYNSLSNEEKKGLARIDFSHSFINKDFANEYTQAFSNTHNIEDCLIQKYNLNFLDFYGTVNLYGTSTYFDFFTTLNNGYLITFQYYGDGCDSCIAEIENVAKSVKSTLPASFYSTNSNNKNNTVTEEKTNWVLQLLTSLLFTIICYMFFPIIRILINKGKFDEEKAKKIALWNSIIIGGIFAVLTIDAGIQWSAGPAFLYYYINKTVLTKKNCSKENIESTQKEESKNETTSIQHICLSDPNEKVVKQRGGTYGEDVRIEKSKSLSEEREELLKRLDDIEKKMQSIDK